ncbi:MAG: bifunctional proline dehydrogenase/L-glutamate gamma-semialdehyde dehydrogenase PutA, partial [Hyphomicrobiales bacterium]
FEPAKAGRCRVELLQRLLELLREARRHGVSVTIDAEEAERLDLTLEMFAEAALDDSLRGWNGVGLAVQAYSKRAVPVLEWLAEMARFCGRRIPVRLVKGAYWDAEIKAAQEQGLSDYPVFTRKSNTDVSYLACAKLLLSRPDCFYPQFASHNAHTIAAVHALAAPKADYEFQRLHGMGEGLYEAVIDPARLDRQTRIYAPVGSHEDLLAYLVRRLLENGSNTSFVHRLADDAAPIGELIADPVARVSALKTRRHPGIPLPAGIFGASRHNSHGLPLWLDGERQDLQARMEEVLRRGDLTAAPIVGGVERPGKGARPVASPHDRGVQVGAVSSAGGDDIEAALKSASGAAESWDRLGGQARADILAAASDIFEQHRAEFLAIMVREAGKTLKNAQGDLREAVDFLRYYASEARRQFAGPMTLPGPTGERNELSLHGRGVFACISPWNFPLAIFTGQVAAALAAGNAVVAKPAEQTPLIAALAVRLLHRAGVPGDVLHLLPGDGPTVGAALVADPRVSGVAFTGSNETAASINRTLAERKGPIVPLIAETGGINAMIVDSSALPEQVVRDAVTSAFDSAGQRCSALRLLCLQEDSADRIVAMLLGAIEELAIGDPLDFATDVGPVIDQEAKRALDAHKQRMRGEAKELIDLPLHGCDRGSYVSPAVYQVGSVGALQREVFGPVLHLVRYRADRLGQLCDAINATGYGLTAGIHTRIESTAAFISSRLRVGNLYINRNQIGAVVGVQPFGGEGLSGTGPKAGGPHTLARFAVERTRSTDITASGGNAALLSLRPEDRD